MAVVNLNGPLYMTAVKGDPVTNGRADNRYAGGRVHSSVEKVTVTIGDQATSTYTIGRLPKNAVLLPFSSYEFSDVLTGSFSLGDATYPTGLINAGASTADSQFFFNDWTAALNSGGIKPLWQLLGYATEAAAPAQIDLIVTLNTSTQAVANAIGVFNFVFTY